MNNTDNSNKTPEIVQTLTRPILTGIGFLFFLWLTGYLVVTFGAALPIWAIALLMLSASLAAAMVLAWFGPRTLDAFMQILAKQLSNLVPTMLSAVTPAAAPAVEKPATGKAAAAVESAPAPVAAEPEPFDVRAFDKAVAQRAEEVYGKVSASNRFFSAREIGMTTRAANIDQALDYWNYLSGLAYSAFTETWGYNIDEAEKRVSEPGCPNCKEGCGGYTSLKTKAGFLGPEFYGAYLDLERTKTTLLELEGVKAKGIDWKAKLYPQQQTLYHLGEMAKYLS